MDGVDAISGQVNLSDGRRPILFYANDAALRVHNPIERVIIRVVGGPAIHIGPYGFEDAYLGQSSVPTIMVALGYSGTADRSLYPDENFTTASREVAEFSDRVCDLLPRATLLLIGESLGGVVAVSADQKMSRCGERRRTLLISPLVDSVSNHSKYILTTKIGRQDWATPIPLRTVHHDGDREFLDASNVASGALFDSFFAYSEKHVSLMDRLSGSVDRTKNTYFMFGGRDQIIRPQGVSELARMYSKRTKVIEGMGHISEDRYKNQIAKYVDSIFETSFH
jgi:alpha-beta hydrolase superfamily lysophospholipase